MAHRATSPPRHAAAAIGDRPSSTPSSRGDEPGPRPLVGSGLVGHRRVEGHDPGCSSRANAVIRLESMPPEHNVPTGTSAISRRRTARAAPPRACRPARRGPRRRAPPSARGSTAAAGSYQRRSVAASVSRSIVEQRPGREAVDPRERRRAPFRPAVADGVRERRRARAAPATPAAKQRADLRGEPHRPAVASEIERLDARTGRARAARGRGRESNAANANRPLQRAQGVVSPRSSAWRTRLGVRPAAPFPAARAPREARGG